MIIPKEIKLFNQTIKVQYMRTLIDKRHCFGEWDYRKNTIRLQQSTRKNPLTSEQIEQTLIHEATHAMLDLLGYSHLSNDEKFVSSMSNLIHQFITQI